MSLIRREVASVSILALACAAGVVARVWLASRGHNYDMESWIITADLVLEGKNVYANTFRHNYGPPWFLILGALRWIHNTFGLERLGEESFHMVVAGFLSLADVGITLLLYRAFGLIAALFLILNPLSMLITGYHTQIDNLALLPALGAWLMLCPRGRLMDRPSSQRLVGAALLLGLSLSIKHILIFFPIWLIMCRGTLGGLSRRLLLAGIAYGLFAAMFVPFIFEPNAWTGFRRDVLEYEGWYNRTLLLHLIDIVVPPAAVDSLFGIVPQGVSILNRLFLISMLLAGWLIARRWADEIFYLYLLTMLVLTHSMADQYLVIPLIACAVYWRHWPAWVYVVPATLLIYWAAAADAGALPMPAPRWHPYASRLSYQHAQIWLLILLVMVLWRSSSRKQASP